MYSDYFLQLENMKMELLVIVNKNVTVNSFLGLVHTARHAMEILNVWRFIYKFITCEQLKWSRNKVAVGEPVAGKININFYYHLFFKYITISVLNQINCITLSTTLFLISILGLFLNQKNILIMLMSLEMMFLSISFNLIFLSVYLDDIMGQIFALLILTVAAAESSIGLAILVVYYRIRSVITVELMSLTKG